MIGIIAGNLDLAKLISFTIAWAHDEILDKIAKYKRLRQWLHVGLHLYKFRV
jgi:hypothetical protein